MCGSERKVAVEKKGTDLHDENLALALAVSEAHDRKEWETLEAIGTVGAPHLYKSPCCGIATSIAPSEIFCTIFICAVKRSHDHKASTQMYQHNEVAAAAALAAGELSAGCGKQYRFDKVSQALVLCTGL
jgi:hypothetical protein